MSGSLTCVGTGILLGGHLSPLAQSHIEQADVVFSGMSDGFTEQWALGMAADVRSLQSLYGEGKSRNTTYDDMVNAMLDEVRQGKKVVGAFYGHPGIFAKASHLAVIKARQEGFDAQMIPGISAEACLYADLGLDPGKTGCQHFETTQLMLYQRRIDPSALLILWQPALAGDLAMGIRTTGRAERQLLVELLSQDYPLDHECILYEAATTALHDTRMERIVLSELPFARLELHTTLVLPPSQRLKPNQGMREQLQALAVRSEFERQKDNSAELLPFSKNTVSL
ncbi:SAM-dependent methyltransferase [Shewanella submarina]|uniref:SAM-dependent methyltransferase n=1 Tax=Shewanella submarina TaxID=2016376 RepID=A0ABV7G8I2_9GAMM|nr:SAM-dependent methyltransferase [Shewanella submarina]MCL1036778.1 SAM-dependent methyltransferase [Shewanella submarina]